MHKTASGQKSYNEEVIRNESVRRVGICVKACRDQLQKFEEIFGFTKKVGNSSVFAGTEVEAMKAPYLGKHGHIAVGTTDVDKAVEYLKSQGVEFNMDSAKVKDGKTTAIYLKDEIGGFAVHLVKK